MSAYAIHAVFRDLNIPAENYSACSSPFRRSIAMPTSLTQARQELLRYFPIGLIVITEGHFKILYRDLIDSGEPFCTNAANHGTSTLTWPLFLPHLVGQSPCGEFIAALLSHSNLGQVEKNLSILLHQDFSAEFTKRLQGEDAAAGHKVFQIYLRQLIVETFRERHILLPRASVTCSPANERYSPASRYSGFSSR